VDFLLIEFSLPPPLQPGEDFMAATGRRWIPALLLLPAFCAADARAGVITYTIEATASGVLGGERFTGAELTITAAAETADISMFFPGVYDAGIDPGEAWVTVAGVGTAVLDGRRMYVFVNQEEQLAGFGEANDLLDMTNRALAGYDLVGSIGPLRGAAFAGPGWFPTSLGLLRITRVMGERSGTFTATEAAEPAAVWLAALGLAGMAVRKRRKSGA
jgi:hypothetical protein